MFLSINKKNNIYPCKPQFYYVKVGFKGVRLFRYMYVFVMKHFVQRYGRIDLNVEFDRLVWISLYRF